MKRIILASASPRRKELLSQVGVVFEVIPSMEEEICKEKEPAKLVELLARQKAESVAAGVTGEYIVIGSDTVVTKDGEVLGKPSDKEEDALQSPGGDPPGLFWCCAGFLPEWGKRDTEFFCNDRSGSAPYGKTAD